MIKPRNFINYIEIFFWLVAPLGWGLLWAVLSTLSGRFVIISHALAITALLAFVSWYFYQPFQERSFKTQLYLFEYPLYVVRWIYIIAFTIALLIAYSLFVIFISKEFLPILDSFIFAVVAGPCLEEFLSRSIFAKYNMSVIQFVFFNCISSLAFTLMHLGFQSPPPTLFSLFFIKDHFFFSFLLGIIAYKSKRIELSIGMHAASNIFRAAPFFILGYHIPILSLMFACFELLIVAGISSKETSASRS